MMSKFAQSSPPTAEEMKAWVAAVASAQDKAAFGRLYAFFAPRVASFMMRSGASPTEAEDIAQEAMVSLWRKAHQYDPHQSGVSTWVFTIARNLRIDRGRRAIRAAAGLAEYGAIPSEMSPSAEEGTLDSERDAKVRKAMETLSQEQATVLRMSFFSEKPHAQIARELAIPLGTVKSRARLAMAKIRAILEREL